MFAEIITIGDELLIGQVVDTNSAWMAQKLNAIGIRVKQITSVSDNAAHIYKALTEAKERAEVVFITGGLGPTKDDITKSVLLDFFGGELEINEQALKNIHAIFARYNKPVLPANHQQAAVPSSCEIILNLQGTAPGMYFFQNNCHYFSMPGVPFEMIDMMENSIIPKLSQTLKLPFVLHETILTAGIGESFLADLIIEEEAQLPAHIQLAYLPKLGQVRLRLSAFGDNRSTLETELNFHKTAIAAETMLIQILRRAKDLMAQGTKLNCSKPLFVFLSRTYTWDEFANNEKLLLAFTDLDDHDIWAALKDWKNEKDKILRHLCESFLTRKLFKCKLGTQPLPKSKITEIETKIQESLGIGFEELSYFVVEGSTSNAAYVQGDNTIKMVDKQGQVVELMLASDLPTIQALSKIVKKYYFCCPKSVYLQGELS